MKRAITLSVASALAFGWLATATQVVQAQHFRGVPRYRVGIQLFSPQGTRITAHQDNYRYVVPSGGRYGAFYSYDDTYYYTPPLVRAPGQPLPQAPRPMPVKFGSFSHHDELADRLETLANQFCLDLYHNYQENPNFDEVYAEAYKLLQAAKYVHNKDNQGDHAAVQRSVNSIDELFHHIQGDIRGWGSANRRQVGPLNLAAKTEEFEAVLHHLMYDVGVKPSHDDHDDEDDHASPRREEAPAPRPRQN